MMEFAERALVWIVPVVAFIEMLLFFIERNPWHLVAMFGWAAIAASHLWGHL